MKMLLRVTAIIEVGAGAALLSVPSLAVKLLFGSPLGTPAAVALGRLAGAALFTLGAACWLAHGNEPSQAARGLTVAMLLYNAAAVVILAMAGIGTQAVGVVLWPAVAFHAFMAVWCIACLQRWMLAQSSKTQN